MTHSSAKARRGDQAAIYNINRDFLDLLLQQGYTDLAEKDITHQDIEKVLDFEGNEAMTDQEVAKLSFSKKTSQKSIQKYEENETLKLTIDKVASHRISQDMIAFRASTCKSLEKSFLVALLTLTEGEIELMMKINGCPVIPGTDLEELIGQTLDKSTNNGFKGADYIFLELTNRGSAAAALTAMSISNSISSTSDSDSASSSDNNSASNSDSDSVSDGDGKAFQVAVQVVGDIRELGVIQEPDATNSGGENDEDSDLDLDAALVSAGNPQLSPADTAGDAAGDIKPSGGSKGGDDHIGISISELLGSIFNGFRGRGDRGLGSGSETDGKDDAPETVTEPQGERQKSSTSVRAVDLASDCFALLYSTLLYSTLLYSTLLLLSIYASNCSVFYFTKFLQHFISRFLHGLFVVCLRAFTISSFIHSFFLTFF